eukprot:2110643-Alexandrium_andersonii.AAC.1
MLALQSRIKGQIPADYRIMLWHIERAGELLTKHQAGHDGRAPRERIFGKPCRDESFVFGEL